MSTINRLDEQGSATLRIIERTAGLRQAAILAAHSADPWYCLVALILLIFFGSPDWSARAVVLLGGTLITAVLVFLIKYTVRRQRPEGSWGSIYRLTNPHSFPSGHAARCAMLAVVGIVLGPSWFGWLLAIWAVLVSIARVGMGVHYLSDILGGAGLGLLLGWLTLALFFRYEAQILPWLSQLTARPISL